MPYQNAGTPIFYINHFSKEINPTTINTYSAEAFTYSFDLKPNYVMLLGTSSGLQITADIHNTLVEKVNYYIEGLDEGFSLAGYALMDYTTASTSGTLTIAGDLAELVVGRYYDMPHSPDLSLSMSHEYGGIKTITTKGGSTLSNTNYYKPAKWGDREAWQLGDFPYYYSGRRSWDLSFSYISDTDIEPYSYYGNKYTNDSSEEGTDNWFQNVLYYTMGGHLPFIFCPDPSIGYYYNAESSENPPRVPEFAICRFDMNSFKRTQISFKTYNIKVKIVESW